MIPEQYWQLLRRWFWLIGTFAIAGAALAVYGMPYLLGATSSHDASATIVVSHYVSPTRIVTTDQGDTDNAVVADYTRAIALYADTPQFVQSVRERLAAQGIPVSASAIEGQLRIEAAPELFRINVHAAGGSTAATEAMVTAAADVLIQRAEDEEARVAFGLVSNLDQQRAQLIARLDELSAQRVTLLRREIAQASSALADRPEVTRIFENAPLLSSGAALSTELADLISEVAQVIGDPELISVDVELTTVQNQLETLTAQREAVLSNRVYSAPITLLNPTEIVETQSDALPTRDLAILGGAAGAVVGWAVINLLDRMRAKRRGEAPAPLRVVDATPALAPVPVEPDMRLRALIERSAEVERRARALAAATTAPNGREALAGARE